MAVTQYRKDEQLRTGLPQANAAQQGNAQKANSQAKAYTGLAGVSQGTAQQVGQYQSGYQAGQSVQQAQQQLQGVQAQKPQGYTSKYGTQLDQILQEITNPEKFKYSFNDDELFRYYADLYTQKGKQAAMDVQGQAAGLTGGYGNSYGAMAGNQAYQQYLLGLYDKGMDLRDRAYQQYADERADKYNQYGALSQADQTDYGRYRDEVGDWQSERDYWTGRYDTESDRDYGRYQSERDYWTGLAQVEHADYRSEQERQEAIRQYEKDFAERQRQFDTQMAEQKRQFDEEFGYSKMSDQQKYAYNYVMEILQGGQMPSLELLQAAGLSEADAQKIMSQYARTTGGGSGGYTPGTTKKPEVKTYGGLPYDKAKAAAEAGTAAARARAEEEYWQPKRAQHSAEGARLTGPEKAYQYKKTK